MRRSIFNYAWGWSLLESRVDPEPEVAGGVEITGFNYTVPTEPLGALKSIIYPNRTESYAYSVTGHGTDTEHFIDFITDVDSAAPEVDPATFDYDLRSLSRSSFTYDTDLAVLHFPSSGSGASNLLIEDSSEEYDLGGGYSTLITHYPVNGATVTKTTTAAGSAYRVSYIASSELADWRAGRVQYVGSADGAATNYSYQKGDFDGTAFTVASDGNYLKTTATTGIAADELDGPIYYFNSVSGQSKRTVTIAGPRGIEKVEHIVIDQNGDSRQVRLERYRYEGDTGFPADPRQRLVQIDVESLEGDQIISKTVYDANDELTTYTWDTAGVMTEIKIYADGRRKSVTRVGVTTEHVYTGRTTTTTIGGVVAGTVVRDTQGRTVQSTDATGAVSSANHGYITLGTFVEQIAPGAGPGEKTLVNQSYWNGRLKSVTGTGTVDQFYEYEYKLDGALDTAKLEITEYTGTNPSLRKVVTEYDQNGTRALTRKTPNPDGGADIVTTYSYTADQQLERTSSTVGASKTIADQVTALAEAGATPSGVAIMGGYRLTGLDSESDGLTLVGDDRVTEQESSFQFDGTHVWRESILRQYYKDNTADAFYTVQKDRVSTVATATGLENVSKTTSPGGETITTTTEIEFATATATTVQESDATDNAASTKSTSTSIGGELKSMTQFGASEATTYDYDSFGRLEYQTNTRGGKTKSAYSEASQLERTNDPYGNATRYAYVPPNQRNAGRVESVTNPEGEVVSYDYNNHGQVSDVGGSGTYKLKYEFDSFGALEYLKTYPDAEGDPNVTQWVYDPASGVLTEKIHKADGDPPETDQTTAYTYWPSGAVHTRLSARGIETTYGYNQFGDLISKTYVPTTAAALVSIGRDRLGRPTTVSDSGGADATTHVYDDNGKLESIEYGVDTATHSFLEGLAVNYSYCSTSAAEERKDALKDVVLSTGGSLENSGTAVHTVHHEYDSSGRLWHVEDPASGTQHAYIYESGTARYKEAGTGDGTSFFAVENRSFDRAWRLTGIKTTADTAGAGTTYSRHGYLFDRASRREKAVREDGTYWKYGYNDKGEVVGGGKYDATDNHLAGHQFAYDFDGIGNRKSSSSGGDENGNGLRTVAYTPNEFNQYTEISNPDTFDVMGRAPAAPDPKWEIKVEYPVGDVPPTYHDPETNGARQGERFWLPMTSQNRPGMEKVIVTGEEPDPGTDSATTTVKQWVPAATQALTYDADGNLDDDGRWDYTWGAENRLRLCKTINYRIT